MVLRASNSQYSSILVLRKMKTTETHMCVDYKITTQDNYPIPPINGHLDMESIFS